MEKHLENLKPVTNTEEAKERGRKGGIASGEARREKAKMSRILQEWLESEHQVVMSDGQKRNLSAKDLLNRTIAKIMARGDSASVSMIKTIGELLEGSKTQVNLSGSISSGEKRLTEYMQEEDVDSVADQIKGE